MVTLIKDTPFANSVLDGLYRKSSKYISSEWFYDAIGSELFQLITEQPEYYLTECEANIFRNQGENIVNAIGFDDYLIYEIGAGLPVKTKILLETIVAHNKSITYFPIDTAYSNSAFCEDAKTLIEGTDGWGVSHYVSPMPGEGIMRIKQLLPQPQEDHSRKLFMFLGSSIGNFDWMNQRFFFRQVSDLMQPKDRFLIGFDICTKEDIVLPAYSDSQGVTSKFNLNLLQRINRELGGQFKLDQFEHYPRYDSLAYRALSALRSKCEQSVSINDLDIVVNFEKDEIIHTEISQKYCLYDIFRLGKSAGFKVPEMFFDNTGRFAVAIYTKN